MQQQPRRAFWALFVPSKNQGRPVPEGKPAASGPVELDLDALRHVAGGAVTVDTPKGTW